MKFLSLVVLSGLLTVSCAHHKKACCKQDKCEKSQKSSCCKEKKADCNDGHCKKDEKKAEKKKQ